MLSRLAERISVGQNPSSNLKARGVRVTLKCGTGEKEVQTPDVILLSLPRETVVMVQKILEVYQTRQTRETWACAKDLSPQAMETPDAEAAVDEEWKDVIKKAQITERKSTLFHWWTSATSKNCEYIPDMFERAISSVETILCLMNLYIEIFVKEKWFDN